MKRERRELQGVRIVYEDENIIVADKPAGLLTVATETERSATLYAVLRNRAKFKDRAEKVFIVHRLDREASGLVVFAKTAEAKEKLQDQFKKHTAGRVYVAVVEGRVDADAFSLRSHLAENKAFQVYVETKSAIGKPAVTHVRVVRRRARTSMVEVRLETGRKHQIRVHLSHAGHPIVGDKIYGSRSNPIRRLALHGVRLSFRHPSSGKRVEFESPPPPAFESI